MDHSGIDVHTQASQMCILTESHRKFDFRDAGEGKELLASEGFAGSEVSRPPHSSSVFRPYAEHPTKEGVGVSRPLAGAGEAGADAPGAGEGGGHGRMRLRHTVGLVRGILQQTPAGVLEGDVHYPDKVLSLVEPHNEAIRKGKTARLIEFGKLVKI